MADKQIKTTSSESLDEKNELKATPLKPNVGVVQTLTKLSLNLNESYQLVKQRQQKYNEMCAKKNCTENLQANRPAERKQTGEWQEVVSAKNKLKRKKKLSASLTSVSDTVNQEKRTRIEGIQLNCRGKLQMPDFIHTATNTATQSRLDKLTVKPPVVPKTVQPTTIVVGGVTTNVAVPPPRLKRKLQENVQTIQKLNTLTEQLRLEINELKSSLSTERVAVRSLRAQNESESRKWKNEVKKLQHSIELMKKKPNETIQIYAENSPAVNAAGSLVNYEIQRLTNEINMLKEANKALEEKKVINCDADRRKAADIRTLKDNYEIRLTQLTKSAKTEISRLLEEIKTKERNIGQLKKDLQIIQNSKTKNINMKEKNVTTKTQTNQTTKKPKKVSKEKIINNETTTLSQNSTQAELKDEKPNTSSEAQVSNEMTQLKDIELINNTKNLQKTTKILTTNSTSNILIKNNDKHNNSSNINNNNNNNNKIMLNDENINKLLKTTTTATLTAGTTNCGYQKEYHSLPHEILTPTTTNQHNVLEYGTKDINSDTDSALSSAPPSISPQPPAAGMETADIWQTIRTYTQDIEKLQKEIETLHKENELLKTELNLAKETILETEKNAKNATDNTQMNQLMKRMKQMEEQEHQLQTEANELREQNELLEFRILELEETHDKWSLQSHTTPSPTSTTSTAALKTSQTTTATPVGQTTKDIWSCDKSNRDDPLHLLFGSSGSRQMDSGLGSSPSQSQQHSNTDEDMQLMIDDDPNEEFCRRVATMLTKPALDDEDKQCLQQLLSLLQQLDMLSQRSGPDSLNANSSSDEPSSLEFVKSRVSDYSSASSTSSARFATSKQPPSNSNNISQVNTSTSRIVATVQPYNSNVQQQHQQAPTNTPTSSPRKSRQSWQSNSLSESGVFVELDFLSDSGENNVCTQTDFEEDTSGQQRLQRVNSSPAGKVSLNSPYASIGLNQYLPNPNEQKRLQYYKERLEVLESKVLIYESSGDLQAKHLADRLQREIQLEKDLKELLDRVECLECENATLDEEKCEFEEAENDTRLRLQRLEIELEILTQRNVELELSKEALSAKYKDCHSECLILRDDLSASETRIYHLEEDKQQAKRNLESLYRALPLLLIGQLFCISQKHLSSSNNKMSTSADAEGCKCKEVLVDHLRAEIKCLRRQIHEQNETMESADSHWDDMEREYKCREKAFIANEACLKQKIGKLQECLRDDARAANEKILQLEETEKSMKTCLVRITKEYQELLKQHKNVVQEFDSANELMVNKLPLKEALEEEKKKNKELCEELHLMTKHQRCTEDEYKEELDSLRTKMNDLRKDYLQIEVTNSELKEEVSTLEKEINEQRATIGEYEEKCRVLQDELREKEELLQEHEKKTSGRSSGLSLAQELNDSPSKRLKYDEIKDLRTATIGLGNVLSEMEKFERSLPTHTQFQFVARDVKKLADKLLDCQGTAAEDADAAESAEMQIVKPPKIFLTEISEI